MATAIVVAVPIAASAHPSPTARRTGAPGDTNCTACHSGTVNSGPGSVSVSFPTSVYVPGSTQRLTITVTDAALERWAFQLTARLASNLSNGQAGSFAAVNTALTTVLTSGGIQFAQTTSGGTQQGVAGSASWQVDWTPPSAGAGNVVFYVAGLAANGSGTGGDNTYLANYTVLPVSTTEVLLSAAPSTLQFSYLLGGAVPLNQTVSVGSNGPALNFTVAATGASWLSATPGSGSTPGQVSVSVNPAGLALGSYNGALTITAVASNSPVSVAVTLTVTSTDPGPGPVNPLQFKYVVDRVAKTRPGEFPEVTFSVRDPANDNEPYELETHPAFTQTANGTSRLFIQIGWDTRDYTNTGSGSHLASPPAAAQPIAIDALSAPRYVGDGKYRVTSPRAIPLFVTGTGVAGMEGHPAGQDATGAWTVRVPVKSVVKYFQITDAGEDLVNRRRVVDSRKCESCHGQLTAHGNNRTSETQICVVCHNPNATDVPFRRTSHGPETPIDFKVMIHSIHGAVKRTTSYVVIGRNGSVNDFSGVVFPDRLSNCQLCHREDTYRLPLASRLGTTVNTQSVIRDTLPPLVSGDPSDDVKVTPTAATCSACHDSTSVKAHMVEKGGSFSTTQALIDSGAVRERCVNCHGKERSQDVERVHRAPRR